MTIRDPLIMELSLAASLTSAEAAGAALGPGPTTPLRIDASAVRSAQGQRSMVTVPSGVYTLGHDCRDRSARPAHPVSLAPFAIDQTEVTNQQYAEFRRRPTLRGLTPHESICQTWREQPARFRVDPTHLTPGPKI